MILTDAARALAGGACAVVSTAREMAEHAAWYMAYQVNGSARETVDAREKPS